MRSGGCRHNPRQLFGSLAVGQTYAMAFAETGRFAEATTLQQETIIGYQRSILIGAVFMGAGLFMISLPDPTIFKFGLATITIV